MISDCLICFENVETFSLICHNDHRMCKDCLVSLAKTSDNCPVCRADSVIVERFRRKLPENTSEISDDDEAEEEYTIVLFTGEVVTVHGYDELVDILQHEKKMKCLFGQMDSFSKRPRVNIQKQTRQKWIRNIQTNRR